MMVDPTKIVVIVNLEAPRNVKQLCTTLGHTGYYRKFIKACAQIIAPVEKLLKKDATFYWEEECQRSLDVLKEKMVIVLILLFPYWKKEFHVHIDASCIVLGGVLTQAGEGEMDHPIPFTCRKLSNAEKNYSTTEHEWLAMVYALQKFRHYLLGGNFKMYTNHSALKYLVNKPVLGGKICRWLLLFQEYEFDVIVKPRKLNVGLDYLSRIETREEPNNLEEWLPDVQLFKVHIVDNHFVDIIHILTTRKGIAKLRACKLIT